MRVSTIDRRERMPDPLAMSATTPSKITAHLVSVWRDDSLIGVALAEREDSSGWNLVFERSNAFTDADRKAGQDNYCITNEAGVAVYGGVSSWSVAGTELALSLAEGTANDLGLAGELGISLALSAADIEALKAGLAEILK
jgi:Immunity protein 10